MMLTGAIGDVSLQNVPSYAALDEHGVPPISAWIWLNDPS